MPKSKNNSIYNKQIVCTLSFPSPDSRAIDRSDHVNFLLREIHMIWAVAGAALARPPQNNLYDDN